MQNGTTVFNAELPPRGTSGKRTKAANRTRMARQRTGEYVDRRMIAWDGEGMKLSGTGPQHYVLFGCSAEPHTPLVGHDLTFVEIADYALAVSDKYPNAFHVGYYFKYDQNMIVKSLPWRLKLALYEKGKVQYTHGEHRYFVSYVPGKKIRITRTRNKSERSSILIEDIAAFWAQSFVGAYRATFPDAESDPMFQRVIEGKQLRASMMWEDLSTVREYWFHEIAALERLATRLKEMMTSAGFPLTSWYGPGAFANAMRRKFNLADHEWGGKEANLKPVVHEAIKCAYYGGHFEQYQVGRMQGPIYAYDINSAYPAAFLTVPTMRQGGHWEHISRDRLLADAQAPEQPLTVYHVRYSTGNSLDIATEQPQPLPHRDDRGNTTYPCMTNGWYWAPEITVMANNECAARKMVIDDGWRWVPADEHFPWREVIIPMYKKRQALKRGGDPAQMVFKLGPNSLYGKMAQRVGFDQKTDTPPRAHTLCIAGYITSWCRAMILRMMYSMWPWQIIAVETDGIYCTVPPDKVAAEWPEFRMSKELGEWGMTTYDEIVYLQNGVYLTRQGQTWLPAKSRGFPAGKLTEEMASRYLASCVPGQEWPTLEIDVGETFLGLGTAINRSRNASGQLNTFKAAALHCVWQPEKKLISARGTGKRQHHERFCGRCKEGASPNDKMHKLWVASKAIFAPDSVPYSLPWEADHKDEAWRAMAVLAADTIPAEQVK